MKMHVSMAGVVVLTMSLSAAGQYTFVKVVDDSQLTVQFPPTLNDAGEAAFQANTATGAGVFRKSGDGPLITIAETGAGIEMIGSHMPSISASGMVAFRALVNPGDGQNWQGVIFKGDGGDLTTIAASTSCDDGGAFGLLGDPFINNSDHVAFTAGEPCHSGPTGTYLHNGVSTTLLYNSSNAPKSDGTFFSVALNNAGLASVVSGPSPGAHFTVFIGDGGVPVVVEDALDPDNDDWPFAHAVVNDKGSVLYFARAGFHPAFIYLNTGSERIEVAATDEGGYGGFNGFGASLNNNDEVAFRAQLYESGDTGIFTGPDPEQHKVIAKGDELFGSTVFSVESGWQALNNHGQIAFMYSLWNGESGVAIATPAPPPCPADLTGGGSVGVPDLLMLLSAWGPNPGHSADLDGNGSVGVPDLLQLLAAWGPCP